MNPVELLAGKLAGDRAAVETKQGKRTDLTCGQNVQKSAEPDIPRVATGIKDRAARLKARSAVAEVSI